MKPINYQVTITKPKEGRTDYERFNWYDYDTPNDLRLAVATYCNESVDLGWDVLALDDDSKVVFVFRHGEGAQC